MTNTGIPTEALDFCAMAAAPFSVYTPKSYEIKKDDFSWSNGTHFVDGSWIPAGDAMIIERSSVDETIRRIKAKNVKIIGSGFSTI